MTGQGGSAGPGGRERRRSDRRRSEPFASLRSAGDRRIGRGRRASDIRDWRRDRFLRAGLVVGAVLGAVVTVVGRRAEQSARRGLVDWPKAEEIAVNRLRRAPGALTPAELHAAEPVYARAMDQVVPALSAALQTELPGIVDRSGVVSRQEWIAANVTTFADLLGRMETELVDQIIPTGSGLAKASMAIANRLLTTRQFGMLLAFLGQRVLGQYDIALISAETAPGRLMFVDENIRQTARGLDVPLDPFRTWIALHETTHAFEFEAHPWLRPYLASRLERQLSAFSADVTMLSGESIRRLGAALRSGGSDHWMESIMTDEQRRLFRETQAVMSLLEGFGDYVMDEVGRDLVPDVETISAKFHARRERRTTFERAMMRLTGMDLKMAQYRKGEEFVAAIAKKGGPRALQLLWQGPETLPQPDEIERPAVWLARVMPAALSDGPAGPASGGPIDGLGDHSTGGTDANG